MFTVVLFGNEAMMTAEDTNDVAKPEFLTTLNRATLENLEKITKGDPAIDLWPHLREQMRKYRAKCDEVTGKPKPPGEVRKSCVHQSITDVIKQSHLILMLLFDGRIFCPLMGA